MIPRYISEAVRRKLNESNKIIIVFGPRQVGKTTLVRTLLKDFEGKKLEINADEGRFTDIFSSRDLSKMRLYTEGADLLFIDEAQRIPNIGINLKILHDATPALKIIVTGSSSFELANQIKEPLTGRTWSYSLFPIALLELKDIQNPFDTINQLETYLRFGLYPDVLSLGNIEDKMQYLDELTSSYLYKDIFELTEIKKNEKLVRLLQLLAFQIGQEVSLNELGQTLGMSKDTVASYIDLLEKAFVIFRLSGFSRNLRKEISKSDKIYFYDLGVRNAIIDNFNDLNNRADIGQLWENFLVVERRKKNMYEGRRTQSYFWRTYTGAELDYVEESAGKISGFEFKWTKNKANIPKSWQTTYPDASFELINRDNFLPFLT